jgi:YfiH family protein
MGLITDRRLVDEVGTTVAFTMRTGGFSKGDLASLNMGLMVGDDPRVVDSNRHKVLYHLGISEFENHLISPVQVHGDDTLVIAPEDGSRESEAAGRAGDLQVFGIPEQPIDDIECDAVIDLLPGVPVIMCFADCVPVVLVAPGGAFSVVHSGWRGSIKEIAGKALTALSTATGCSPSSINAYIGPHICAECYEVSQEMIDMFGQKFGDECVAIEGHLDLEYAVRRALLSAGISEERITSTGICTAESTEWFFSHRAENGNTGRFAAVACRLDR